MQDICDMVDNERLKDIIVDKLSFEVIKDGGYSKKNYESYTVILKVTNHSAFEKEFNIKIRYTSILFGLMVDDYKESDNINMTYVRYSTFKIKAGSFGFLEIRFDEIKEVCDGDRMELEISGKTKLLLVRNNGEWFVFDKETKSSVFLTHPELESQIEHFVAIEDRMGITIQNFCVRYSNDGTLYIDFEVLATTDDYYKKSFCIYSVIYDKVNNIVSMENVFTGNEGFKGYGKYSSIFYNFDFPISEIGFIRVFPA